MNLTIEKPSTLIKIAKTQNKEQLINTNIYKNFQHEGINFYNINLSNSQYVLDESKILNDLSNMQGKFENDINETKNKKIKLWKLQNLKSLKPKEIITNNFTFSPYLLNSNIDQIFIFSTLKFDLRVKNFIIFDDYIMVYFFCLSDSLSFYRQYYHFFELSFQVINDWRSNSLDNLLEQEKKYLFSKKPFDEKNDFNYLNEIKSEKTEYGRKRFFSQVEYFNNLKSGLSKVEILQMINDLDNCNIDFVFKDTKKLAVGSKSNKIMQDAIKIMSGDEISKTYDCLEYDIVPICSTKHGAYTIQTLLNYSTNKHHRRLISKYFKKEGEFLLAHDIGNYTFQKLLTFDPNLVRNFFLSNFEDVLNSELGFKVFKRCSDHLEKCKNDIMKILLQRSDIPDATINQIRNIIAHL